MPCRSKNRQIELTAERLETTAVVTLERSDDVRVVLLEVVASGAGDEVLL